MPTTIKLMKGVMGVALVLATGACGGGGGPVIHEVEATYPVYASAAELTAASDLVVTATAKRVVGTYRLMPEGVDPSTLPPAKRAELGVITTDVEFGVFRVHKGPADESIVVTELGGTIGGSRYVAEEQPNSRPGQTLLLFLQRDASGKYAVVGGPQGRYLGVNGRATSMAPGAKGPLEGASVEKPNLGDTTPIPRSRGGTETPVSGKGGKPGTPIPPPGG